MWFELSDSDGRLAACATEGCGGPPTWWLEADGVGANYCSGCAERIRSMTDTPEALEPTLPCDVTLPPATIIRKGVKLSTLLHALEVRGMPTPPQAPGVVKPLEWVEDGKGHWKASALTGSYHIVANSSENPTSYTLRLSWSLFVNDGIFDTLAPAKVAAQADYERRILSTLVSAPPVSEEELREACAFRGPCSQRHGYGCSCAEEELRRRPPVSAGELVEPPSVALLRGPLSSRATSAEFNEWQAREVVAYIDAITAANADRDRLRAEVLELRGGSEPPRFLRGSAGEAIVALKADRNRLARELEEAREALRAVEEYFDDRADADQPSGSGPIPNEEMRLLIIVRDALK